MFSLFKPLAAVVLALGCFPTQAMSLQEFDAMTDQEQARYFTSYVVKMADNIATQNPDLARAIVTWFSQKPDNRPLSDGAEALLVEQLRMHKLAKQGKADLAKVQIEGLIVYVVKQHFKA